MNLISDPLFQMRLLKIIALLLTAMAHIGLTTNVYREEDFYLLHSSYDLLIYDQAEEITKTLRRLKQKSVFKKARSADIVFKDLEKRVLDVKRSLQALKSPSFSTTSYFENKKERDSSNVKLDTAKYDRNTGVDREEAFH